MASRHACAFVLDGMLPLRSHLQHGCAKGTSQIAHRKREPVLEDISYVQFGAPPLHISIPGRVAGASLLADRAALFRRAGRSRAASSRTVRCAMWMSGVTAPRHGRSRRRRPWHTGTKRVRPFHIGRSARVPRNAHHESWRDTPLAKDGSAPGTRMLSSQRRKER